MWKSRGYLLTMMVVTHGLPLLMFGWCQSYTHLGWCRFLGGSRTLGWATVHLRLHMWSSSMCRSWRRTDDQGCQIFLLEDACNIQRREIDGWGSWTLPLVSYSVFRRRKEDKGWMDPLTHISTWVTSFFLANLTLPLSYQGLLKLAISHFWLQQPKA